MSELSEEEVLKECNKLFVTMANVHIDGTPMKALLDLYQKEKEKNKELEKQYKILEVEKVRYNIQYLESDISQIPDTAMVYHSMKRDIETLKEQKIKLEKDLQKLLEERN